MRVATNEQALRPLRDRTEGRISIAELVRLGAEVKLERMERQEADCRRHAELREQFLESTRTGEAVDFELLGEVHDRG